MRKKDVGYSKKDLWISILLFVLSFAVYLKTLAPTITFGDSGELITAAYTLGIPHPPGFPLWCLLAKPFTFIPLNNIAWRVNLSSAFFASCAVVLVYLIMKRTSAFIIPAGVTALLVAFSRCFWSIAVIAEVYTLLILFMLITIFLLLLWQEKREDKYLYGACFIYGLSLTIHLSLLFLAPIFIFWVLLVNWRIISKVKQLSIMVILFLLGLTVYLYLPLRSLANPPIDWGDPQTWERFLAHIMRRAYIKGDVPLITGPLSYYENVLSKSTIQTSLNSVGAYFKVWSKEIPVYIGGLALVGVIRLFKDNRVWFVITLIIFLSLGLTSAVAGKLRDIPDSFPRQLIPSFIVLTLWIGYGIEHLLSKGAQLSRRLKINPKFYGYISSLLVLLIPLAPLNSNYSVNNRSQDYFAYDYGMNILRTLDKDAILFTLGDNQTFPLIYLKVIEKERPDVTVYDRFGNLFGSVYGEVSEFKKRQLFDIPDNVRWNILDEEVISRGKRPVYYTFKRNMEGLSDYILRPTGLLYQIQEKGTLQKKGKNYWRDYELRGINNRRIFKDGPTKEAIAEYYLHLGEHYSALGKTKEAQAEYERAGQIGYDRKRINYKLGAIYTERGWDKRALRFFQRAVELDANNPDARQSLGLLYYDKERYDEAIIEFKKALAINSHFAPAHLALGVIYGEKGWYDKANSEYKEALRLNPDYSRFYTKLKEFAINDIAKAVTECMKAPSDSKAHNCLGLLYEALGHDKRAIYEYNVAIMLNPQYKEAYRNLGNFYDQAGFVDAAIYNYQKALSIDSGCPVTRCNLALAYEHKGWFNKAVEEYKKVIQLNPDYASAHLELDRILRRDE
ncbi:MAG: DUF2723 domain-containing protein [Candidatus Omnitrophica bacterium]|nr:DUF2723 domain-containing protein [Candidatus Omnitrophota bacterium]